MLEYNNIIRDYDETAKNSGQLDSLLHVMFKNMREVYNGGKITLEDKFKLCEYTYVLDQIHDNYIEIVDGLSLIECYGLLVLLDKMEVE